MDSMFTRDKSETHSSPQLDVRVCRTIDCGRNAHDEDLFCPRCREEIDAVRDMARRRFVIYGMSRNDRPGVRRLSLRRS
jgi:hypothetical protein